MSLTLYWHRTVNWAERRATYHGPCGEPLEASYGFYSQIYHSGSPPTLESTEVNERSKSRR